MLEESKPITPTPVPGQNVINIPLNMTTPLLYTNGATINMTQSDVQISFSANGRPIIAAAMAWTTAKNLHLSLLKAISEYERKTNSIIPDINEIGEQLKNP